MHNCNITTNNDMVKKIIKDYSDKINEILTFFSVNGEDIKIKVLNYEDFKEEYEGYFKNSVKDYSVGFIEDVKKEVIILNYDDYKYTSHYGETYEQYIKVIIHEFVHIIHSIACNYNYPSFELREGIAVYLSEQYDFEDESNKSLYYGYGKNIYKYLKKHSKEELLKLLNC